MAAATKEDAVPVPPPPPPAEAAHAISPAAFPVFHPLPFADDVQDFDKSKLTGAAKRSKAVFSGTKRGPGGKGHRRSAAKEASQQRPRASDELGYEMLLQRIRSRRVVPFVGAGMSMPLLPSWWQVLNKVGENLGLDVTTSKESAPVITEMLREKVIENKYIASRRARKASSTGNAAPRLDRQSSLRTVPDDLSDEFLKVFKECIRSKGSDTVFHVDVLAQGAKPTRWLSNPDLKSALKLPVALMSGPWPLIMTTNWDTLLEAAYQHRYFLGTDTYPLNVWDDDHPSDRHYHRLHETPQVRYRANVQEVFAELRAGLNPPRLLKLHGDFTERGRPEVVAGHADYRHLMVHEVAFARLMHYICSNYSLLFFGCSLTDPDLLATLDSMVESLGGEVGPHFWLTADDVSDARADFLRRHYSVYTVRTPEKFQFTEVGNLLVNACNKGWQMTRPLKFKALSFGMGSWVQGGPELQLIIESSMPEDVLKRSTSAAPVAVGLSCGCGNKGYPSFGSQGRAMLGHRYDMPRGKRPRFAIHDGSSLWRTMLWREEDLAFWPVCGQDVQGSGSLGSLFDAVQHFVQRASWKIYTGDLDPPADAYRKFYGDNVPANHDDLLKQRRERAEAATAMSAVLDQAKAATPSQSAGKAAKAEKREKPRKLASRDTAVEVKPAQARGIVGTVIDFVLGDDPPSDDDSRNGSHTPSTQPGDLALSEKAADCQPAAELGTAPEVSVGRHTESTVTESAATPAAESSEMHSAGGADRKPTAASGSVLSSAVSPLSATVAAAAGDDDVSSVGRTARDETGKLSTDVAKVSLPTTTPVTASPSSASTGGHDELSAVSSDRPSTTSGTKGKADAEQMVADCKAENRPVQEKSLPSKIILCLPLISAGGGHLLSHEVLSTTISAVGSISKQYLPPCPVDVVLCLSTPDPGARGGRLALMADIQGGRLVIGDILSRSVSGLMEFTCIAPFREASHNPQVIDGYSTDEQQHWRCRRVVTLLDATLNDLRRQMDFVVDEYDATGRLILLGLNITDGSVVKLDAFGNIHQ